MGEYRLLESKELSRGGFLTLLEERFASPDGEKFTRWVVRHPGAVAAVPVVPGSDAGRLVAEGKIIDAKSIIGLLLAERHLSSEPEGG